MKVERKSKEKLIALSTCKRNKKRRKAKTKQWIL
jgi:hypothetical protein